MGRSPTALGGSQHTRRRSRLARHPCRCGQKSNCVGRVPADTTATTIGLHPSRGPEEVQPRWRVLNRHDGQHDWPATFRGGAKKSNRVGRVPADTTVTTIGLLPFAGAGRSPTALDGSQQTRRPLRKAYFASQGREEVQPRWTAHSARDGQSCWPATLRTVG